MEANARKQREITNERIDQTKPAFIVIDKAGGLTSFCRDYDYKTSTVYGWLESGFIPTRPRPTVAGEMSHQAWILHRSRELKHGVKPTDFIEQPAEA
jgi:hypothetical protein